MSRLSLPPVFFFYWSFSSYIVFLSAFFCFHEMRHYFVYIRISTILFRCSNCFFFFFCSRFCVVEVVVMVFFFFNKMLSCKGNVCENKCPSCFSRQCSMQFFAECAWGIRQRVGPDIERGSCRRLASNQTVSIERYPRGILNQ